jgi:hypothetical protein
MLNRINEHARAIGGLDEIIGMGISVNRAFD